MALARLCRYHWLKFLRLQDNPQKIAWGMALGVFIGITPTIPFHLIAGLTLATLFRVSPVAALIGIQIGNPVTMPALYVLAYKVGQFLIYGGQPLVFPETFSVNAWLQVLWQGGVALQVGGVIIALPPAIVSYFVTLWLMRRYRRRKIQKAVRVLRLSENPPAPSGPET
jgi:uncharacterized protein (DUF2062 family)